MVKKADIRSQQTLVVGCSVGTLLFKEGEKEETSIVGLLTRESNSILLSAFIL